MHTLSTSARPNIQSAATLSGYRVRNEQSQDLGTIEELMIDPDSGRVVYAVLSFGGFWGFGDKLFAIPWSLLALNSQERIFVLHVDREVLERAPAFNYEDWPDFTDKQWGTEIHNHYGRMPASSFPV